MDKISRKARSENMRRIKSKSTKPELLVRSLIHGMGFRYRLHSKDLPGKPDLVFRKKSKAIFVHGCFWHQHKGCREGRLPGSNAQYWGPKLARNIERDEENQKLLHATGWSTETIWECETKDVDKLIHRLKKFLRAKKETGKVK